MRDVMTAAALSALVGLVGCGGSSATDLPPVGGVNGAPQDTITWGPRLAESGLSALVGADDEFGGAVADGLARAARAAPNGASQSSLVDAGGRTTHEMSVQVVRDVDLGGLAHEITDGARIIVQVPFPAPRQGFELAAFTGLIPGIEPDLTSYPHEVLGVWAWEGEGVAGAFWSRSPSVPPVEFGPASPTGLAVYEGDAAGVLAEAGTATKFVADVRLEADFNDSTDTLRISRPIRMLRMGSTIVQLKSGANRGPNTISAPERITPTEPNRSAMTCWNAPSTFRLSPAARCNTQAATMLTNRPTIPTPNSKGPSISGGSKKRW